MDCGRRQILLRIITTNLINAKEFRLQKVTNLQKNILNQFTHHIISIYSEIHIEDLDINGMIMSKKMGKNLHRSLFGKLRDILTHKCEWNNRKLVLVDRFYPST